MTRTARERTAPEATLSPPPSTASLIQTAVVQTTPFPAEGGRARWLVARPLMALLGTATARLFHEANSAPSPGGSAPERLGRVSRTENEAAARAGALCSRLTGEVCAVLDVSARASAPTPTSPPQREWGAACRPSRSSLSLRAELPATGPDVAKGAGEGLGRRARRGGEHLAAAAAALAALAVCVTCLLAAAGHYRRQAQEITVLKERVRRAEDRWEREHAYAQAKRSELAIRRAEIEARERAARRRP